VWQGGPEEDMGCGLADEAETRDEQVMIANLHASPARTCMIAQLPSRACHASYVCLSLRSCGVGAISVSVGQRQNARSKLIQGEVETL